MIFPPSEGYRSGRRPRQRHRCRAGFPMAFVRWPESAAPGPSSVGETDWNPSSQVAIYQSKLGRRRSSIRISNGKITPTPIPQNPLIRNERINAKDDQPPAIGKPLMAGTINKPTKAAAIPSPSPRTHIGCGPGNRGRTSPEHSPPNAPPEAQVDDPGHSKWRNAIGRIRGWHSGPSNGTVPACPDGTAERK